jgi:hypothetical protein
MGGEDASGRHVFLVRSSLQYLMATALAADLREHGPQACRMLFMPDMLEPALFLRATQGWAESPFDRVDFIEPRKRPGFEAPRRESGAIRRQLRTAILKARPVSMTVFNDCEEPGQVALIATARHFPQALRRCAEDGSLAYTNFVYRSHGLAMQLRQKLRMGRQWHDVRVLGTHPLVQEFIALHPSLVREELRHRPLLAFPSRSLESAALRSLAARLCEATGFMPQAVPAGATVLTVSHSSYAARNPEYPDLMRVCARKLVDGRGHVFVKYHPRESQADYLGLCAPGIAKEIARALPIECLYLMLRDRPLHVVGGMSTTLLTAGLLMPQVRCAALVHATATGDTWDQRLLEQLRITPLADAAGIDDHFDALQDPHRNKLAEPDVHR